MSIENQPYFIRFCDRLICRGFSKSQAYGEAVKLQHEVQDELDQQGNYTQEELLKKMEETFDSIK